MAVGGVVRVMMVVLWQVGGLVVGRQVAHMMGGMVVQVASVVAGHPGWIGVHIAVVGGGLVVGGVPWWQVRCQRLACNKEKKWLKFLL